MLLDDLLETCVVQLGVLGQIVDISNDVAEIGLEQLKIILEVLVGISVGRAESFLTLDNLLHLDFAGLDSGNYLLALEFLEGKDFVELSFELLNEGSFIVVRPGFSVATLAVDEGFLEGILEVVIGDVVPVVVLYKGLAELLAKSVVRELLEVERKRG